MKIIEFLKSLITARGLVIALIALFAGYFLKTLSDSLNAKSTIIKNCNDLKDLENVVDAISYASQLGRLDVVSLILALLGIVLGFGAIAGFMHIKESSHAIAKATSKKVAEKVAIEFLKNLTKDKDKGEASEDKKEATKNIEKNLENKESKQKGNKKERIAKQIDKE